LVNRLLAIWDTSRVLVRAFREQRDCIRDVHRLAGGIVRTPEDVPPEYRVGLGPLPESALVLQRNLFSTLFLSIYHLLGVPPERRLLFGKLNHLFRIWVTGADNLLDAEDKVVLPLVMAGGSRIMREVVAVMAADRVLNELLWAAVAEGTLDADQARQLSARTLQALLGSAGQEATEEGGVVERPPPEEVLFTIHWLKTGMLFHIPFVGPDITGEGKTTLAAELRAALLDFGLGCQLLDDVRDMAVDLREQRHNYLLSSLFWQQPEVYAELGGRNPAELSDRLYQEFPEVSRAAALRGYGMMRAAVETLSRHGLALRRDDPARIAKAMFQVLDLLDMAEVVNG
jgi:hypothetical protein